VLVVVRPADWPDERWQSLAELAVVLLLVVLLLWCSLDAGIVVTDASVSDIHIFILLPLDGALTNGCWSCHGEHRLGSACFTLGGSRYCLIDFRLLN
jgi:hypothetical protein